MQAVGEAGDGRHTPLECGTVRPSINPVGHAADQRPIQPGHPIQHALHRQPPGHRRPARSHDGHRTRPVKRLHLPLDEQDPRRIWHLRQAEGVAAMPHDQRLNALSPHGGPLIQGPIPGCSQQSRFHARQPGAQSASADHAQCPLAVEPRQLRRRHPIEEPLLPFRVPLDSGTAPVIIHPRNLLDSCPAPTTGSSTGRFGLHSAR